MEKPSGPFVRKRGMFFGYCAEATIRETGAEAAEQGVCREPGRGSQVIGAGAAGAKQRRNIALLDRRQAGDVDHQLVHADAADDWSQPAVKPNVAHAGGERGGDAVGIADGQRRDGAGAGGCVAEAVADALACSDGPHTADPGMEG